MAAKAAAIDSAMPAGALAGGDAPGQGEDHAREREGDEHPGALGEHAVRRELELGGGHADEPEADEQRPADEPAVEAEHEPAAERAALRGEGHDRRRHHHHAGEPQRWVQGGRAVDGEDRGEVRRHRDGSREQEPSRAVATPGAQAGDGEQRRRDRRDDAEHHERAALDRVAQLHGRERPRRSRRRRPWRPAGATSRRAYAHGATTVRFSPVRHRPGPGDLERRTRRVHPCGAAGGPGQSQTAP